MAPRPALLSVFLFLSACLPSLVDAQASNLTGPVAAPYLSVRPPDLEPGTEELIRVRRDWI